MSGSVGAGYFEALYAGDPDPWGFATSAYEREKYAASLAALPAGRFGHALEVGCSIGVLTRHLAGRCGRVLGIDGAETALVRAREVCGAANVVFERRMVPGDWPEGRFDLIVFSEVLYYLDTADLRVTTGLARGALAPGGTVLLVHYLGETGAPLGGGEAAEGFIAASGMEVVAARRAEMYRIDVLRSGLAVAA